MPLVEILKELIGNSKIFSIKIIEPGIYAHRGSLRALDEMLEKIPRIFNSTPDRSRVIGVDRAKGCIWLHGTYESNGEAMFEALCLTRTARLYSDPKFPTLYFAYDPQHNRIFPKKNKKI